MLQAEQCAQLRQQLPELNLAAPCLVTGGLSPLLESYLEFYGFLEVLKDHQVDYFMGFRSCSCDDQRWRIATHYWRLPQPQGTVLLVHGLFDHVGLFQALVSQLLALNCAVIAVDLPGHGLSDGTPTVIARFEDYGEVLTDTVTYFNRYLGDGPLYGVGQSTGAAALMAMAFAEVRAQRPARLERLVFLGPLVRPRRWPLARWIYRLLGRRLGYVPRDFSVPNSNSLAFRNFLRHHDPMQARVLSVAWVGALHRWVEEFPRQPVVSTPTLIVQGTADRVVDWRFNLDAIQEHFSQTQINIIKGAMHHLANEADPWRKVIFSSISQFLRQRGPRAAAPPAPVAERGDRDR